MGVREAKRLARKKAIEDAGLQLLLDEGFERCSVERIASQVGIARGTFYLYYPDKVALFEALAERFYGPLVEVLESISARLKEADSRLAQQRIYLEMAARLAVKLQQGEHIAMLHFREHRSAGPSGEIVGRWMARIEGISEQILEDAMERGLVGKIDVHVVTLAIVGAVERLCWAWLQGDRRMNRASAALQVSSVFFKGIAGS